MRCQHSLGTTRGPASSSSSTSGSLLLIGCCSFDDFDFGSVWVFKFRGNSSILLQPNPIFAQSVKVEELNISSPGHVLYDFYNTPPLDTEISFEFNALHVRGWDGCT
ncbi:unnamed protein product [Prunus armeniaca]|uniref:Uncharacterized protein n=1 Tax=Prunus armeniaca TaxID=36596 RepID=A0A6J5X931_PRUAR|nr:unnamed protein product [Prunus armeniaca]